MADYFSFEEVMGELELGEEDLKRMVSEGELRAFRDENKMKFKREDVETLKKGRVTEPTIILPSTPAQESTDETVLDLDIGQEAAQLAQTAPEIEDIDLAPVPEAAPEIAPEQTDDDLLIQPEEVSVESEETFIEEETDTGLTTEPLKLADEVSEDTIEAEAVSEEVAAPRARGRRMAAVGAARVPVAVEEEIERKKPHWIWTILILLAFVAAAYSGFFLYEQTSLEMGAIDKPSDVTAGTAEWILNDFFWNDSAWTRFHEKDYPDGQAPPFPVRNAAGEVVESHRAYDGPTFLEGPIGQEEDELGQVKE